MDRCEKDDVSGKYHITECSDVKLKMNLIFYTSWKEILKDLEQRRDVVRTIPSCREYLITATDILVIISQTSLPLLICSASIFMKEHLHLKSNKRQTSLE